MTTWAPSRIRRIVFTSDVAVIGAGFAGWGFLSAVFRDFLAAAIGEFTAGGYKGTPIGRRSERRFATGGRVDRNRWTICVGIGGRIQSEWVVDLNRNGWSGWAGILNSTPNLFEEGDRDPTLRSAQGTVSDDPRIQPPPQLPSWTFERRAKVGTVLSGVSGDADGRYTLFAAEKDGIATIWLYSTRTGKLTPAVQGTTPTWQP